MADLPRPARPPVEGLSIRRSVGINGTRLSAMLGEEAIGDIEMEIFEEGERLARPRGLGRRGNLHVAERYQRRGVGTWLFGEAADGSSWPTWTGCWTTPTWRTPTRPASAMTVTGRCSQPAAPGADRHQAGLDPLGRAGQRG